MNKKKNFSYYILIIFTILICFPKSFMDDYVIVGNIIYGLRIFIGFIVSVLSVASIKKNGLSKLSLLFFVFILVALLSSLINSRSIIYFLKVYFVNISVLLFSELTFRNEYKNSIIDFISKFLYYNLIINLFSIVLKNVIGINIFNEASTYYLGMDNRFILFIIPCLLSTYIMYIDSNNNKYKNRFIFTFIIGILSLLLTWSVTSLISMIVVGLLFLVFTKKNIKLNSKIVLLLFLVVNYLFVVLKINNIFNDFIVGVLHKSSTLSYRTILWDEAIRLMSVSPISRFLGLGYFDTSSIIPIYVSGAGVNHLHNLIIDITFSSGLIGMFIYFLALWNISKNIDGMKDNISSNVLALLFLSLLIVVIFDSFELYPIYYFILCQLYYSKKLVEEV